MTPTKVGQEEFAEEGSAVALYQSDWCNPALFTARISSPKQATLQNIPTMAVCKDTQPATKLREQVSPNPIILSPEPKRREQALSNATDSAVESERALLLAAINGLSAAADAAIRRAEAAEAAMRAAEARQEARQEVRQPPIAQRVVQDPCSAASMRALEARIRDSVMAEVKDAVRTAAEEATSELRAAAEEIRRLRAQAPADDERAKAPPEASCEKVQAMEEMLQEIRRLRTSTSLSLGEDAACETEEATTARSTSEQQWAGLSRPSSGGSSPFLPPPVISGESTSSDEAEEPPPRDYPSEDPIAIENSLDSREDEPHVLTKTSREAERLRVRDVVSKLERQREKSNVRSSRLIPSASTSNLGRAVETSLTRRSETHPRPAVSVACSPSRSFSGTMSNVTPVRVRSNTEVIGRLRGESRS